MRNRNFRWFWLSGLGQSNGQGMMLFTLPWLVLSLPGSSLSQLGIVIALQGIPMFAFLLFGGVLADRMDRRLMLIVGQTVMITNISILATLTITDAVQVWHVYLTSTVTGLVQGFTMPARGSMARFLVDREDIMNAVALNSMLMNTSRIIGPAIGGGVIALMAIGPALYVNAGMYALGVTGLFFVRVTFPQQSHAGGSPFSAIASGVRYIVSTPLVLVLVGLTLSLGLFGMPYAPLLPAFAKEILELEAGQAALLLTVTGVGSLTGNIGLAFMGDPPHKNLWAIGLLLLFAVMLFIFAVNPVYALVFPILFLAGLGSTTFIAVTNAMVQLTVPREYLGRVVSFTQMGMALMLIGSLPMGLLGDAFGLRTALAMGATALLAVALLIGIVFPPLRRAHI